jgi:hypothetical protein
MSIGYYTSAIDGGNLFLTHMLLHLHSRCTSVNFQTLCAHTSCMTPLLMPSRPVLIWTADFSACSKPCWNCHLPISGIFEVGTITLYSFVYLTLVIESKSLCHHEPGSLHSSSLFIFAVLYLIPSLKQTFSYEYLKKPISNSADCHQFNLAVLQTIILGHVTFPLWILFKQLPY